MENSDLFILPLDPLDLNYINHNCLETEYDLKVKPLWRLKNTEDYYRFEIYSDYKDYSPKYKCHICDIQVPVMYSDDHEHSEKHRICLEIMDIALERTRGYVKHKTKNSDTNTLDGTYFCNVCSISVLLRRKTQHNSSQQHLKSLEREELLQKLLYLYSNEEYYDAVNVDHNTTDKIIGETNQNLNEIEDIDVSNDKVKQPKINEYLNHFICNTLVDQNIHMEDAKPKAKLNTAKNEDISIASSTSNCSDTEADRNSDDDDSNNRYNDQSNTDNTTNYSDTESKEIPVDNDTHEFCNICKVMVPIDCLKAHPNGLNHVIKLKETEASENKALIYQIKISNDELLCRVCDEAIIDIDTHISTKEHFRKYSYLLEENTLQMLSEDRLQCTTCNCYLLKSYELYHIHSKEHILKLRSANRVARFEKDVPLRTGPTNAIVGSGNGILQSSLGSLKAISGSTNAISPPMKPIVRSNNSISESTNGVSQSPKPTSAISQSPRPTWDSNNDISVSTRGLSQPTKHIARSTNSISVSSNAISQSPKLTSPKGSTKVISGSISAIFQSVKPTSGSINTISQSPMLSAESKKSISGSINTISQSPKLTLASTKSISGSINTISRSPKPTSGSIKANSASTNAVTQSPNLTVASTIPIFGSINVTAQSPKPTSGSTKAISGSINVLSQSPKPTLGSTKAISGSINAISQSVKPTSGSTNAMSGSTNAISQLPKPTSRSTKAISGSINAISQSPKCIFASTNAISQSPRTTWGSANVIPSSKTGMHPSPKRTAMSTYAVSEAKIAVSQLNKANNISGSTNTIYTSAKHMSRLTNARSQLSKPTSGSTNAIDSISSELKYAISQSIKLASSSTISEPINSVDMKTTEDDPEIFSLNYQFSKTVNDELCCKVCDEIMTDIDNHILSNDHSRKYDDLVEANRLIILTADWLVCTICNRYLPKNQELNHIEVKQHKKIIETLSSFKISDRPIFTRRRLKELNRAENDSVTDKDSTNVGDVCESHIKIQNLKHNAAYNKMPKFLDLDKKSVQINYQVKKMTGSKLFCLVCAIIIPFNVPSMNKHIESETHTTHYESVLKTNRIEAQSNNVFLCGYCQVEIAIFKEIDHINGARHLKNKEVELKKSRKPSNVYKSVKDDTESIEIEYLTLVSDARQYC